jgi:hypothetical protein
LFESHALYGSGFFDRMREGFEAGHVAVTDGEIRKVFTRYLRASAFFHRNRYNGMPEYLGGLDEKSRQIYASSTVSIPGGIARANAEFLGNPSDTVVALETARIQVPFDDERDFHATATHQGSVKEHLWWRWNTYRHAKRYMDMVQGHARELLGEGYYGVHYLTYHQSLSAHYAAVSLNRLEEAIAPYLKNEGSCLEAIKGGEISDIGQLLARLDVPNEPDKPVNNPDLYDIAARIESAA